MNKENYRYIVQIMFDYPFRSIHCWDITERVKTYSEAQKYRDMIDNTVRLAQVYDTVTNTVAEVWK